MSRLLLPLLVSAGAAAGQKGPGSGPWQTGTPESQGLSSTLINAAAAKVNSDVSSRYCYLVVKNGVIVHESYYGSNTVSSTNAGWSTTKSLCSTMFGIAAEQGWARLDQPVAGSVRNARKCNAAATYRNVLTMTGTSPDISKPRFAYDTLGTDCYDTLSAFVGENNPEGLTAQQWKSKYLWDKLGFEHSTWSGDTMACGTSSQMSCRDLARHAQLWLNEGEWAGEQLLDREYSVEGTRWVYDDAGGDPYGYGLRLRPGDPVDPGVAFFGGIFVQCAFISREHQALVLSMGNSLLQNCKNQVWEQSREAIVSHTHPLYNATWEAVELKINRGNVVEVKEV